MVWTGRRYPPAGWRADSRAGRAPRCGSLPTPGEKFPPVGARRARAGTRAGRALYPSPLGDRQAALYTSVEITMDDKTINWTKKGKAMTKKGKYLKKCEKFKTQLLGKLSQSSRDSFQSESDSKESRDDRLKSLKSGKNEKCHF